MKLKQSVRMAAAAVWSNKIRSFLTMLGIIIGVFSVTILISIVQSGIGTINSSMEGLGGNLITVTINDRQKKITYNEVMELENGAGVKIVAPYLPGNTVVNSGGKSSQASLYGVTKDYAETQNLTLQRGRMISELDQQERLNVCVIGAIVAEELFGIEEMALDQKIRILGIDYRVIGLLERQDDFLMGENNRTVFIPLSNAQRILKQTAITGFYITSADKTSLTQAQNTVTDFLKKRFTKKRSYQVINMANIMDMMNTVMNTLSMMLGGIAAISLLVGGIGIMNIMLVSVTERTKEIGIRKAIGAQKSDIIIQFMIESVLISLMGGIIGMLLSQGVLSILNIVVSNMEFAISPSVAGLALVFSISVGLIFGIYPANKAANLKPIDALRSD